MENVSSIAKLLALFKFQVGGCSYSLALVRAYGQPSGVTRRKDRDLNLHRVRAKANPYRIVPIESIVRGTLLVEDITIPGDCFIVDTIDGDMFLRVPTLSL
jgi:hypothetical protein